MLRRSLRMRQRALLRKPAGAWARRLCFERSLTSGAAQGNGCSTSRRNPGQGVCTRTFVPAPALSLVTQAPVVLRCNPRRML